MRDLKSNNVQELIHSLAEFENHFNEQVNIKDSSLLTHFISSLGLDRQQILSKEKGEKDAVKLMTFHSAKGLEFPVCFLVGVEDHIIPHEKSLLQTGLEEERRLMYVAMTRAKNQLVISMAKKRKRMGKESFSRPSRFLYEIPKSLIQIIDWLSVS